MWRQVCGVALMFIGHVSLAVAAEPANHILAVGKQPQADVAADGSIFVAFGRGNDVFYAESGDGGKKFTEPVNVGTPGVISLGMRRGPRIAIAEKVIVVAAVGGPQGKGKDGDVQAWRSTDHGKTWAGPVKVNDVEGSAREGLHALAASPSGEFACAWLDLRTKGTKIYVAVSTDGGKTWGTNVKAYESPEGPVCQCCHPSVAYDAAGTLHVMWRNALDGNRDMWICSSRDHGATFSAGEKLGQGAWKLNACPMDGGAFAYGPDGHEYTLWRRDKQILATGFEGVGAAEQVVGLGEQPWLAVTPGGPLGVWLSKRGGDLLLRRPNQRRPEKLADDANDPVIASNRAAGAPAIVLWETGPKQNPQIAWRVIPPQP